MTWRPWAIALWGFLFAAGALFAGFPIEQALFSAFGVAVPAWATDWLNFSPLTFVILALFAALLGAATALRPFAAGRAPLRFGLVGFALGIGMIGAAVAATYAIGGAVPIRDGSKVALLPIVAGSFVFLIQSFGEEAFFRGWLLPALARYWRWPVAIVVSSAIFVAAHNLAGLFIEPFDPANLFASANPAAVNLNLFLGGVVFALLYRLTGGIVAPTLFHFAWNWSDALFFGLTPNPGKLSFGTLIDLDLAGPAQWGGVADGMMANIFATVILLAILISLALFLRREARPADRKTPAKPATAKASPAAPADPVPVPAATPQPDPVVESAPMALASKPEVLDAPNVEPVRDDVTIFMPGSAPLPPPAPKKEPEPVANRDEEVTIPAAPLPETTEPFVPEGGLVLTGTHEGCVREINEDRFISKPESGLFAVADGMGGHKFGDRASTMIVEHLDEADTAISLDERVKRVSQAIQTANRAIFDEAQTNGSRMGSTVVALMTDQSRYAIVWAGDSRAYRLRGKQVERLTKDHTQVQEMVDRGLLAPEDVARHPMSHVLVRAVGVNPDIELDVTSGPVEQGDVFFLCSDGIYDVLEEDEIGALLEKATTTAVMEKMIKMALDLGARDNVTGIIVVPGAAA